MAQEEMNEVSPSAPLEKPVFVEKDQYAAQGAEMTEHGAATPLSKNAIKRQKRHEIYLEKKALRTQLRREKKRARKVAAQSNRSTEVDGLDNIKIYSTVDVSGSLQQSKDETGADVLRKPRSLRRREEFLRKSALNPIVVVDCGFKGMQSEKELNSLSQQLMFTYGINRRSDNPFQLIFAGLYEELKAVLSRVSGTTQWTCELTSEAVPARFGLKEGETVDLSRFVYLTADSETVLETLDSASVYVIGGIVDRNRFKGLTHTRAKEWGIRTARLPIQDNLQLAGCKVLTVNQVFSILERFMCLNDWKTAIEQAIPPRKIMQKQDTAI